MVLNFCMFMINSCISPPSNQSVISSTVSNILLFNPFTVWEDVLGDGKTEQWVNHINSIFLF